ncbi:MAG: WD40 repeat domain-containing protein [Pirellulales bacterium]
MTSPFWRRFALVCMTVGSLRTTGLGEAPKQINASRVIRFAEHALIGRPPVVTAVGITPDAKTLVTAGDDDIVRLFSLSDGQLQAELKGHTDWIRSLAIGPNGQTLYTAGDDHRIRRWNLATGQALADVDRLDHAIYAIALSADGTLLAAVGFDRELRVYETASGKLRHRLICPARDVRAVAFSPDGKQIAAGGRSGAIGVWQTADGSAIRQIDAHRQRIRSLAYSPDATQLMSAAEDGFVRCFDAQTGQRTVELACKPAKVMAALFLSTDSIATAGSDNRILIWDVKTREPVLELAGHTGSIAALACDRSGQVLVSGSYDTTAQVFHLTSPTSGENTTRRDDDDAARR